MTQQIEVAAPVAEAPAETIPEDATLEQRIEAVKGKLDSEENAAEAAAAKEKVAEKVAPPAVDADQEKRRQERSARLTQLTEKSRAAVAKSERERHTRESENAAKVENEKLRARVAELEQFEVISKSEDSYIEYAAKRGYDPTKLADYIRGRLTNPEMVAENKARSAIKPVEDKLKNMESSLDQRLAQIEQREHALKEREEQRQAAHTFATQVKDAASAAPLTAHFFERHGADTAIAFANKLIVPLLPEGSSLSDLHDAFEQFLDDVQIKPATATSNGKKSPIAIATAKTMTNELASARATVAEERDPSDMTLEERIEFVKAKLARTG